jgi:nucleotide-binding universal stress UspA family protein
VISVQVTSKRVGFTNIVLPISDDLYSRQKVDAAISFAKQYAAKIHVLGLFNEKESDKEKFKVKMNSVEKAIKKADLPYAIKIIQSANAAAEALKYSGRENADLIVVLTDYESELTGGFLGLFTKQIVNYSRIPVMSIKPLELGVYDSVSLSGSNSN